MMKDDHPLKSTRKDSVDVSTLPLVSDDSHVQSNESSGLDSNNTSTLLEVSEDSYVSESTESSGLDSNNTSTLLEVSEDSYVSKSTKHSMENVPLDIVEAIAKKLPARSYGSFMFTNKQYYHMLMDSRVYKAQLRHLLSDIGCKRLMAIAKDFSKFYSLTSDFSAVERVYNLPVNVEPAGRLRHLLGSCNGLVCLGIHDWNSRLCIPLIWNPMTNKFRIIDEFGFKYTGGWFGFAFDEISNDFKLVYAIPTMLSLDVKVYHLKTGLITSFPLSRDFGSFLKPEDGYAPYADPYHVGTYFEGNLYWPFLLPRDDQYRLVVFNVEMERFKSFDLPNDGHYLPFGATLCNLGNRLKFFLNNHHNKELTILTMRKHLHIDETAHPWLRFTRCPWPERSDVPVAMFDDVIVFQRFGFSHDSLLAYNVDLMSSQVVFRSSDGGRCLFTTFVETSISPERSAEVCHEKMK